jgi:2-polyprenyl-6-methoxyphenol hydroxylase-like FAD-dependent oxidoreductase
MLNEPFPLTNQVRGDTVSREQRTALVVGAGIGGLSAGIALRKSGWNVRVFERAGSVRELGFGLLVAPNAMAALRELGVADTVLARGWAPKRAEGRRMDGTVFKRADFPPPEALGGPTVVALRQALHGALSDAFGADGISLSSEVAGFTATDNGVALQLANGTTVHGNLLVGADGAGSLIRHTLHPAEPGPRLSGIVAVRGAVHGAVEHLGSLSAIYYLDRGVEAFFVRASDTGIYWALSLASQLLPPGMRDPRAILRHITPGFEHPFRVVTSMTEDLRCDKLIDRDPINVWGKGAATLLGDAAHPVLPHTGQGAAQAIVDALVLKNALSRHNEVEHALRMYERERQPKTAALLRQGRRTARIMRSTNSIACYLREVGIRILPVKPMVKVFATLNRRAGTDIS